MGYVVDEMEKIKKHLVLRFPPYCCELNPIEICAHIKNPVAYKNDT